MNQPSPNAMPVPGGGDPLSQLRDIALPDPVGWWPLAPGWWLLIVASVMAVVATVLWLHRRRKARAYRRSALDELESAWRIYRVSEEPANAKQTFLQDLVILLRRTALQAYPGANLAGTHGQSWLAFLDRTLNTTDFTQGDGQHLLSAPYQPNSAIDPEPLYQLCKRWIQQHGPEVSARV